VAVCSYNPLGLPRKSGLKNERSISVDMTVDIVKASIKAAYEILFTKDSGVVPLFFTFLGENPVLLLPMGFMFLISGINTARRLVKGY
jgi:hypothetical protein